MFARRHRRESGTKKKIPRAKPVIIEVIILLCCNIRYRGHAFTLHGTLERVTNNPGGLSYRVSTRETREDLHRMEKRNNNNNLKNAALKKAYDFVIAAVVCEFRRDDGLTGNGNIPRMADNRYHRARVSFVSSRTKDTTGICYHEES